MQQKKQTKINEQTFHISQEMVLRIVIAIQNVNLIRKKNRENLLKNAERKGADQQKS